MTHPGYPAWRTGVYSSRSRRAWNRGLAFRDALRADPSLQDSYAALKRELAQRHGGDRNHYTAAKSEFVERVLAETAKRQPN